MPPDNVDLARQVMDALGRRDTECLISLAHPDVEWHSFFALGEGGPYRGHEGTRQYMRDLSDAWEIGEAQIDDALGLGDVVLLVGRLHYRGRGSGVESASAVGWILKFLGGKVILFRAFHDPEQTLEAIGRRE